MRMKWVTTLFFCAWFIVFYVLLSKNYIKIHFSQTAWVVITILSALLVFIVNFFEEKHIKLMEKLESEAGVPEDTGINTDTKNIA